MNQTKKSEQWEWKCINEHAAFTGRDGAALLSFKGRLWLLGGWTNIDKVNYPQCCNSEIWSSVDGLEWKQELKKAPWEMRHCFGCVVYQDKIWIIGGDANQKHYQPDVWNSEDGINWTLVSNETPWGNRALYHTLVFDDKIWVMGGQTMPYFVPSIKESVYFNDVWNSEDGVNWNLVTEHAGWSPRGMIGNSAVFNGRMWILGGGTYDTTENPYRMMYNDIWSSNDGVNWKCHTENAGWPLRQYHDVAAFDGQLWVMEGYGSNSSTGNKIPIKSFGVLTNNKNDVWYSPDGITWTELKSTPWKPRHAASVCVHNNALWMVTGNNLEPDVWRLEPGRMGEQLRKA